MGRMGRLGQIQRILVLAGVFGIAGCDGTPQLEIPDGTLSREQFIAAYVDLRYAALEVGVSEPDPAARDSIMASHNVTAQDMFQFLDVYGRDVAFMRDLWDEIEDIIDLAQEPVPYA